MTRLALFDCDGTLVDGQAEVCEAMEIAFGSANLAPPSRQLIRSIVGLSLPQAIFRLAPEAAPKQHQDIILAYKEAYRSKRASGRLVEPLFVGIAELLNGLRGDGWYLGVATGKSARGLDCCLKTHGLDQHFLTLQTADRHPSKPNPSMIRAALRDTRVKEPDAVMIGDTCFDIEMASNAGIRSIGVAWGYHDAAELRAAGASAIAANADELAYLLRA